MRYIGRAIAKARVSAGMTQSDLARKLGVTPQAVQKWESGGTPRAQRMQAIADALHVPLDDLLLIPKFDLDEQASNRVLLSKEEHNRLGKRKGFLWALSIPEATTSSQASEVEASRELRAMKGVPVVGEVKGGDHGYFEELAYPVGHGDGFVDYPTADPSAYALRVRGDSMHPRYRAGEFIVVEPAVAPLPGEDVVVICRDGRKLLKTLAWEREGSLSLLSINNGHPPVTLEAEEVDRVYVVSGRVPARALRKR